MWLGPCVAAGLLIEAFRLADRVQRKTLLLDAANLGITVTTLFLVLYLLNRPDMAPLQLARVEGRYVFLNLDSVTTIGASANSWQAGGGFNVYF